VTESLGLNHLSVMGTSMGCMHSDVGENYPDMMDGLVLLPVSPRRLRAETG
jgi:homoserine acetyltransferase